MTMPTRAIYARRANANAREETKKMTYTPKLGMARTTMSMRKMKKKSLGASADSRIILGFHPLAARPSVAMGRGVGSRMRIL
jgi:hypothetical protein